MDDVRVLLVMGSDSDLPVMSQAAEVLAGFGVKFDLRILSAHRAPHQLVELAARAEEKYQVIIAGAGMAAHLPGVIAAHTNLPVIGVPLAGRVLDGQDALYSIVQMPSGVPVATVGIGAAKNAALLALQILATAVPELRVKLAAYRRQLTEAAVAKDRRLQDVGYQCYLQNERSSS